MTDKDNELGKMVNDFIEDAAKKREPVVIEKETFITVPVHAERIELQPIDHQAYPDMIRELEQSPLSKTFEIPLDENGKIDVTKLPEGVQEMLELVGYLFDGPSEESEAVMAQMIKVAQQNVGGFPSMPFDLPLIRQRQHFGVLSQLNPSDQPQRNMPNKSVGESEYVRPEDRAALLSGYSPEEQMGLKLPDELAQRLRNMNFDQAPSPVSPEFAADMEKMRDVQSEAILTNLEAAGAENAGIGPRGTISFMNPPFSAPFKRFGPVFDAAVARRHIYKDLLNRMNEEIQQGPLAGIVFFTGVTNSLPHIAPAQFVFSITWTHKARNRMKAYNTYFTNLRIKYMQEIAKTDAAEEKKVMERE